MSTFKEINTSSNYMSLLRLLLVVPIWFLLDNFNDGYSRYYIFGLCIFAAVTDILDGYLARRYNQVTEFGKIIDPLADKLAIGVIVVKLYLINEIPPGYFFLIIGRDLLIFTGGIIVSKKLGKVLPSNALGKAAVVAIGIVLLLIMLQVERESWIYSAFYYISIVLIFLSLAAYTARAVEFLRRKEYGSV